MRLRKKKSRRKPRKRKYITLELSPGMENFVRTRAKSFKTLNSYFRHLIAMDMEGKVPCQKQGFVEKQIVTYQREVTTPPRDPPKATSNNPMMEVVEEMKTNPLFLALKSRVNT